MLGRNLRILIGAEAANVVQEKAAEYRSPVVVVRGRNPVVNNKFSCACFLFPMVEPYRLVYAHHCISVPTAISRIVYVEASLVPAHRSLEVVQWPGGSKSCPYAGLRYGVRETALTETKDGLGQGISPTARATLCPLCCC